MNLARFWTFDHGNSDESPGQTPPERLTVRYTRGVPASPDTSFGLLEQSLSVPVSPGWSRLNLDRKRTFDHGQPERRYNPLSWPAFLAAFITLALVAGVVAGIVWWLS